MTIVHALHSDHSLERIPNKKYDGGFARPKAGAGHWWRRSPGAQDAGPIG
jgi:hypothetical protein